MKFFYPAEFPAPSEYLQTCGKKHFPGAVKLRTGQRLQILHHHQKTLYYRDVLYT